MTLASHRQEACERSLAEMETSHQQVMEELQRHHERELQRLQQEKDWLLAEETAATASGEGPGPTRLHAKLLTEPGRPLNKKQGSQCQTWGKRSGGVGNPELAPDPV